MDPQNKAVPRQESGSVESHHHSGRHILINSCCLGYVNADMSSHKGIKTILEGADTPVYLATLPKGATEPYGQFVSERQVVDVDKKCPL
ncbi:carbonyl reductase 1 [Echinococcus multilocularis]|uniref:Carbonyl reductase 1 n=1 Tax=Echinococcus multilocularis TaxID=6211 RepID=A0A087VYS7_ECHMU|nr:carbonyl reductase 1 [Echinococcus multilocularis]